MNTKDQVRYRTIEEELLEFSDNILSLNGILTPASRDTFIKQVIDSMHRIEYVYTIRQRDISSERGDPFNLNFDPIKAAILKQREGDFDESFWLTFLSINYGKNLKHGWRLVRDVYGGLENENIWTWDRTSSNPQHFTDWISANYLNLGGAFGNHRKYESLRPDAQRSPAKVVSSYVNWVGPTRSHSDLIRRFDEKCESDERLMFSQMYKSMNSVLSFGRTSKFDFLTMVAKLGLANISPDCTYMKGATGPVLGANLLFTDSRQSRNTIQDLEANLIELEQHLSIGGMGMQVLEDALCNWQKSPKVYKLFKG